VETKHVILLANSIKNKKRCVAGKEVFPTRDGRYRPGKWIRMTDPNSEDGAVSELSLVTETGRRLQVLDIAQIPLRGCCNDPNHPEDWWFEPSIKWRFVERKTRTVLPHLVDRPSELWGSLYPESVPAGYVKNMGKDASSLYLIRAPDGVKFRYWKEMNPETTKERRLQRLTFSMANSLHDFSVTDPLFTRRHGIYEKTTEELQIIDFPKESDLYLCLSLTPELNGKHYKICATIFGATIFEP
jgi:hypothetical protein